MTKEAALHEFYSGFGIPAYKDTEVPVKAKFPYMTYTESVGSWRQGDTSQTVNLWYYGTGEKEANDKASELGKAIDDMKPIECDEGYIWLKRGQPWCQSMTDPLDAKIKRRYINVTAEFLTFY